MMKHSGGVLRNILIETAPDRMHTPTPLPAVGADELRRKAAQLRREAVAFARHIPRVERESDAYKVRWHRRRIAELNAQADELERKAEASQ